MFEKRDDYLDEKYRAEGWGELAEAALGIRPKDVESQARDVARYAAAQLEGKEEVLRHVRVSLAVEHVDRCKIEYNLASVRLQKARLELAMAEHESRTGEKLFPLHAEGFKRWADE